MTSNLPPTPEVIEEMREGPALMRSAPRMIAILDAVSAVYLIGKLDILSVSRRQQIMIARHAFYWSARNLTARSFPEIGYFINRDHSTVIHGTTHVEANLHIYGPKLLEIVALLNVEAPFKLKDAVNG